MKLKDLALILIVAAVPTVASGATHTIYFATGASELDAEARTKVAEAARDFQETGSTSVMIVGHTDTVGSSSSNQALSERRAAMVREAMIASGVPASAITATGRGEMQLAVQTADGIAESGNRRTEVMVAEPAPAPTPATAPVESVKEVIKRTRIGIGPFVGYSWNEKCCYDMDESWHLGVNVTATYFATPHIALSGEQAVFYNVDADDDGWGSRTALGVDYHFGRYGQSDRLLPYVGANVGYKVIDGSGVGGWFAGPEVGLTIFGIDAKVAYDVVDDRGGNNDWDWENGDLVFTIGYGWHF